MLFWSTPLPDMRAHSCNAGGLLCSLQPSQDIWHFIPSWATLLSFILLAMGEGQSFRGSDLQCRSLELVLNKACKPQFSGLGSYLTVVLKMGSSPCLMLSRAIPLPSMTDCSIKELSSLRWLHKIFTFSPLAPRLGTIYVLSELRCSTKRISLGGCSLVLWLPLSSVNVIFWSWILHFHGLRQLYGLP